MIVDNYNLNKKKINRPFSPGRMQLMHDCVNNSCIAWTNT